MNENSAKRGNVWLGVSAVVVDETGRFLVVKKAYSGLKGVWSFPAGFVKESETADQAAVREVLEETGIHAEVIGCLGVRTGVIENRISDNMIIFRLKPVAGSIQVQEKEIMEARFMCPDEMINDPDASLLVKYFCKKSNGVILKGKYEENPGEHFGYTAYHLFL
ncbi:ADP-ribose pyrophosphatase YjhB (NUDIX family) [Bacillus oleivorans]|uniref:ADP-ribose pyrophosphatase YjhB (NUDIX family) n=1 Tax=Bacillus oleivorans TaxID=1448271 RepID=A0A285D7U3_9BACI|nr:NUDIX domain-containing protein [Bacillus oleivorans]SNX75253.1 ADP-ribose pyrophosphatase YjhB (NUDIX family) [Bacillus oleivorans]